MSTLTTPRMHARAAGLLYLLTHVTSILAVLAYGAGQVPAGVTLELALAIGCVGTGVLIFVLLRDVGPACATTFMALRGVEASVILAGAMAMLAGSWVSTADAVAAPALTQLHAASFLIGQGLVIGMNTIVLGSLLWSSRAVPRWIATLAVAGGAIVLSSDLAQLFGVIPMNGTVAAICAVPIFAFELSFAITLIVRGVRPQVPRSTTPANEAARSLSSEMR
ncbi:MAG TPA: DUF4386 domain-containing protein [Pseudolysinimonas sp.]|jgi:hypothetical protein|nr:DUF4386 domain-containing protein [Pseudolysinimonas sp.]